MVIQNCSEAYHHSHSCMASQEGWTWTKSSQTQQIGSKQSSAKRHETKPNTRPIALGKMTLHLVIHS